jgi:peptidoglycan-associated lipoprotein
MRKPPPSAACTNDPVYFDFNESAITTEGSATLQRNADCIKKTNRAVQLVGHTDSRGTEEYNLALSNQRANSVKNYLSSLGVKTSITTEGRGKIDAKGTDESGFAKDRRVDTEWK